MKRFLERLVSGDPKLAHLAGMIERGTIRFEKARGEIGSAYGMYHASTGEIVLSLNYAGAPSALLAATLAHELQHRYDLHQKGRRHHGGAGVPRPCRGRRVPLTRPPAA